VKRIGSGTPQRGASVVKASLRSTAIETSVGDQCCVHQLAIEIKQNFRWGCGPEVLNVRVQGNLL
jgi:hypothetical protein